MTVITSLDQLDALYEPAPAPAAMVKVSPKVTPEYARLIEASPFVALATVGPEGVDCSPRGDQPGFVKIHDSTTLMMPDRRGNNRIDSLRNIVRDPRCAFLFLIPGSGTTLRANGRAHLTVEPSVLESFAVEGKPPRSVIVFSIEEIYFQCARAIMRSELWNPERHVAPPSLPTAGEMLSSLTANQVGGDDYDKAWPQRAKDTLW
jgi:PPOX class probable FMN-dependent enzyme